MQPRPTSRKTAPYYGLFVTVAHGMCLASAWAGPATQAIVGDPAPARSLSLDEQAARLEGFYREIAAAPAGRISIIVMLRGTPVKSRDELDPQKAEIATLQDHVLSSLSADEFEVIYRYPVIPALSGWVTAPGLDKLAADPDVALIIPNLQGEAHCDVSVPFIGAATVQTYGFTGRGITVAVLDTGIDTNHPDLMDHIADGAWHFTNNGNQGAGAEDDQGHGTNVSGIITSKGTVAPVGVAPDAYILPVKVINAANSWWMNDLVAAINYVVNHVGDYDNLAAMNLSLGTHDLFTQCPCDNDPNLAALKVAMQAAHDMGIAIFVSSGNKGYCDRMSAPACLSSVAAVAAVYDQDLGREPDDNTYGYYYSNFSNCADDPTFPDKVTCFSNRSGCNKLAAPGRSIKSTKMGGGVDVSGFTGTSQAAPHCTALAAIFAEMGARRMIAYTPDVIIDRMESTGAPTTDLCGTSPNPKRVDAVALLASEGVGAPCEIDQVQASDGAMNQLFSRSMDLYGDVLVVGRELNNGAVYIYRRQDEQWVEEQKLTADDPNSLYFGYSVGVSGDAIVVGDPWYRAGASTNVGAAFVFRHNGTSWVKEAKLMASDGAAEDWFGAARIDGNYIVVGALYDDDAAPTNSTCNSGSAYVFEYSGGTWTQVAKLTATDAACGDRFGQSVAISGTKVLVGAYYATVSGAAQRGAAYIYQRSIFGNWPQQKKLLASDGAAYDQFGCKVALDGDVAVVSAYLDDDGAAADVGAVYVYRRGDLGTYPEEAKLTAADKAAGDRFGAGVAIRGDYIAVGAYQNDDAGANSGSAYVFQHTGATWWQRYLLTASDAVAGDNFGNTVALDGGRVAVGAWYNNSNQGSAYIFGIGLDCNANGYPDECDVAAGRSRDCNGNVVPDECDVIDAGDFNADSQVDFADYVALESPLAGPENAPNVFPPECLIAYLAAFDFDSDADLDLTDFASFQAAFGG